MDRSGGADRLPAPMHAQSLLWYLVFVALYRRTIGELAAGLAAMLFALRARCARASAVRESERGARKAA